MRDLIACMIGARLPYRIRYWITLQMIADNMVKINPPGYVEYHVEGFVNAIEPPKGYTQQVEWQKRND